MNEKVQEILIKLAKELDWVSQGELTEEEDKLAARRMFFVAPSLNGVKRYLALGSLPFLLDEDKEKAEREGEAILDQLWFDDYPQQEMVGTLVRRPHNPSGCLRPRFFMIGDAPGVGEGAVYDRVERMFTRGPSSHMLRKALISNGMHYSTWYTNLLRLSTPKNRTSLNSEVKLFRERLRGELDLLRPKLICLLGNHVSDMFDRYYAAYRGKALVITVYHPSYAARQGYTPEEYGKLIAGKAGL